uniref:NADH-ubiquinone oxidoreductase chain 6 n=1 Tax=Ptilodactylidae sp. 2 ACP-2013 TaxID=1434563 RepID=A0A3G3FX26_9COLE|nr:NADH dehydrogenase subunit 6 [Ptilodactylidae sp. 2 ACP-2013]
MLISSTFILALTMLFIKHPLSMGLAIIIQSMLIAFITGSFYYNFWFSYLMFIIVVGGMMVLFIYMTTIASNEMFTTSKNLILLITPIFLITTAMIYKNKSFMETKISYNSSNLMDQFLMSVSKFMNFPANMIMVILIVYLFVVLIAVVKITNITYGPLRQS